MQYRRPSRPRHPVETPELFFHAGCVIAFHHPSRSWAVYRDGKLLNSAPAKGDAVILADFANQLANQRKKG